MLKLKAGEAVEIGDTIVVVKQTKQFQVCLGIRAKRSVAIRRLP